jgi:DNA modification methylase
MLSTQLADTGHTRPWPADQVERWSIERVKPYANNPRLHSEADLGKIAASIRKWGWTMPVLVDEDGELISGHARVSAAMLLELKSIPVIVARGWTEEEKRAYRVADNHLAARASWDPDLLRDELHALNFADFDLSVIGFEPDRLEAILAGLGTRGLSDPDNVPEVPDKPVTRPGDIWLLGKHRVGCGHSTSEAEVAAVLAGSQPHLMVTDPPYGIEYDLVWRGRLNQNGDKLACGKVPKDDRADWHQAYALFPGDVAYVWHGAMHGKVVAADLADCGFQLQAQIVWAKQHFALSRGHYHCKHECCWYAVREGKPGHWHGDRTQTTVWEVTNNNPFSNQKHEQEHGTQKPVECMRRPIANNSRPGQAIYDPFLGSGTSLIAAEMSDRTCYGLELDPAYVDVIVRRWQLFTGRAAIHEASGQPFDERPAGEGQNESETAHG